MLKVDGMVNTCFFMKNYYNWFSNREYLTLEALEVVNRRYMNYTFEGVFQCNDMAKALFIKILNGIKLNTATVISVSTEGYLRGMRGTYD